MCCEYLQLNSIFHLLGFFQTATPNSYHPVNCTISSLPFCLVYLFTCWSNPLSLPATANAATASWEGWYIKGRSVSSMDPITVGTLAYVSFSLARSTSSTVFFLSVYTVSTRRRCIIRPARWTNEPASPDKSHRPVDRDDGRDIETLVLEIPWILGLEYCLPRVTVVSCKSHQSRYARSRICWPRISKWV